MTSPPFFAELSLSGFDYMLRTRAGLIISGYGDKEGLRTFGELLEVTEGTTVAVSE